MDRQLIIITSENLAESFVDFISHKMKSGFDVPIIFVEALNKNPDKIKEYIKNKYAETKKPFYVLLGGDLAHVPALEEIYRTSGKRYPDNKYAIADDNKTWMCSIGRLPGKNFNEMKGLCDRIVNYENIKDFQYKSSMLTIAATDPNTVFLSGLIPQLKGIPNIKYLKKEDYKTDLGNFKNTIQSNLPNYKIINYNGHGHSDDWNLDSGLSLLCTDLPSFNIAPHVLSWACSTANISCLDNFGVNFIQKGAISFLGACAMTLGASNRDMCKAILCEYIKDTCPDTLGELYFRVLSKYGSIEESMKYMLLGDPTLKVR